MARRAYGLHNQRIIPCPYVPDVQIHNGLDKLQDPEGFAKFVVEPYLGFLPMPLLWTYAAAGGWGSVDLRGSR